MSLAQRLGISIFGNGFKSLLNFLSSLLIARALGPDDYGTFAFLLASFTALIGLLEMGTSSAFFTFISKSERTKSFFIYYILWQFFQFILSVTLIAWLIPDTWFDQI